MFELSLQVKTKFATTCSDKSCIWYTFLLSDGQFSNSFHIFVKVKIFQFLYLDGRVKISQFCSTPGFVKIVTFGGAKMQKLVMTKMPTDLTALKPLPKRPFA